jgi:hypothetical protein
MNEDIIDSMASYDDDATKLRQVEAKKNVALTGGTSTSITFDNTIALASYSLTVRCVDASGNNVDYQIPAASETASGFTITAVVTCTMTYTATKI